MGSAVPLIVFIQGAFRVVKVLVVDDSSFVRRSLTALLESDPTIQVVGQGKNGEEAIAMVKEFDPDVVTLDVEMPRMNGLKALEQIMKEHPVPVIMVSALTSEGADTTLKAMELGALDFMPKLSANNMPKLSQSSMPDTAAMQKELTTKVKALARRKAFLKLVHSRKHPKEPIGAAARLAAIVPQGATAKYTMPVIPAGSSPKFDAVAIGVSTGGPPAVQKILAAFPANFPVPILIAQHMPAAFTGPFAKRLDNQCAITVKEAEAVDRLRPGTAYICPGGKHIRLENRKGTLVGVITEEPKEALYKPSANVLMETAGIALGRRALCVMLTGMGNDGLEGTKILKAKGGYALAQSEATCVVYGMPKAIVDAKLADEVIDLDDMAAAIVSHIVK